MSELSVFRALTSADGRLAYYTKETQDRVPREPGCYAWFLPLWLYSENIDELVHIASDLRAYDSEPERLVQARFRWQALNMRVRRSSLDPPCGAGARATWNTIVRRQQSRDALQRILLEASLLMPPLYVGRARDLRRRYLQHISGTATDQNTFHSRFTAYAEQSGLSVAVSDLVFVCIVTPKDIVDALADVDEDDLNDMFEQFLMRVCQPPFSMK